MPNLLPQGSLLAKFLRNLFIESELWKPKMEAGGFEPPSRDASRQVSTCLVALLFFRLTKRQTTGSRLSYSGIDLIPQAQKTIRSSLLSDALTRPTGTAEQDGPPN